MEYVSLNSNSLVSNLPPDTPTQSNRATTALPGHPGTLTALQHSTDARYSSRYRDTSLPSRPLTPDATSLHGTHEHPFRVRLDPLARQPPRLSCCRPRHSCCGFNKRPQIITLLSNAHIPKPDSSLSPSLPPLN